MSKHTEDEVVADLLGAIRSYARCRKSEVLRYQLERDYGKLVFPSKVDPGLIPASLEALKAACLLGGKKRTHSNMVHAGLAFEHMVPLSVLGAMLIGAAGDLDKIKKILRDYYQICWVTKKENSELTRIGLKSKMPGGWTPGCPADARYKVAGIVF